MKEIFSLRRTWGPLFFLTCCPPLAIVIWYTNTTLEGSLSALISLFQHDGLNALWSIWKPVFWGSPLAWKMIFLFASFQLLLMKILPGHRFEGPLTPKGNIPVYKANGPLAFATTILTFILCAYVFHIFSPTLIYDHLGELLGALNIFSLLFCLFLMVKGRFFPSSSDSGATGNLLFDFYWGTELYPRLFGWDLKMFTNCRFGMMSWGVILLSYAAKQQELYGLSNAMILSVLLQFVYLTKFYFWETGYLRSLDIMHDRAGFYICWGCMVWVPCVYTSPSQYLVHHPHTFSTAAFLLILTAGTFCILTNYFADRQRQLVRATSGQCKVWGRKPQIMLAKYTTTQGEQKENVMLLSGWWGVARHFHYIPEILGAFFWTLPALFTHFMPYFYVIFLTILLVDRARRDEKRCAKKYGKDWDLYCQEVPYRMIPLIF